MNSSKFTASTRGTKKLKSNGSYRSSGSRGRGGLGSGFGYSAHGDSGQMHIPKLKTHDQRSRGDEMESETLNLKVPNGAQSLGYDEPDPTALAQRGHELSEKPRRMKTTGNKARKTR
jgi:hypothetical protein